MIQVLRSCGKQYISAFSINNHFFRSACLQICVSLERPLRSFSPLLEAYTFLDPLDQYTVGTAIKSASFASQIVYTYIKPVLSYKRLFTSTPRRRLLRRVMGDAPIGLPPRAIHFWKAVVTRNISCYDTVPRS